MADIKPRGRAEWQSTTVITSQPRPPCSAVQAKHAVTLRYVTYGYGGGFVNDDHVAIHVHDGDGFRRDGHLVSGTQCGQSQSRLVTAGCRSCHTCDSPTPVWTPHHAGRGRGSKLVWLERVLRRMSSERSYRRLKPRQFYQQQ